MGQDRKEKNDFASDITTQLFKAQIGYLPSNPSYLYKPADFVAIFRKQPSPDLTCRPIVCVLTSIVHDPVHSFKHRHRSSKAFL